MSTQKNVDRAADEKRNLRYLRKIPLLDGVSSEQLERLASAVTVRELPRRQVVYLPGDPGQTVYFIYGGRVKCSKVTRDGKELTMAYRSAGQLFGELALIDGAPRDEMAEAVTSAIIFDIPCELFRETLASDGVLALRFAMLMAERRKAIEIKLERLVFKDVQAKLAALLLELAEEYGAPGDDGIHIDLKVTHQEMANLIGSTRETISLTLAQFKKRGLLDFHGRTVVVRDRDGLHAAT